MKIKHPFRLTLITISILLFSWGIIVQILHIINSDLHVQIKEEERAAAAELASANQTATAKAMAEGNFYTSVGEGGLQTHGFQLSDAKNQGDRYVENIQNLRAIIRKLIN